MPFESPEIHPREAEALEKAQRIAFPRPEYAVGKEKLNFEYEFPTGETLKASENEKGVANIVIMKGNETVIDFQGFAPKDTFVTPSYFLDKPYMKVRLGMWEGGTNFIQIGDMRDPKSLLALLHELGHARLPKPWEESYVQAEWRANTGLFTKQSKELRERLARKISEFERNASAEALKIARKVEQEQGIDLLAGFENLDEVQEYEYAALLSYRLGVGEKMIFSDEGLLGYAWKKIKQKTHVDQEDAEQWKFLENLFDKRRLQRKPFSSPKEK